MSSIQTDEEAVETVESVPLEGQIPNHQEEAMAKPRSFSASIKRTLHRFVNWINSIDKDGQEYWN